MSENHSCASSEHESTVKSARENLGLDSPPWGRTARLGEPCILLRQMSLEFWLIVEQSQQ